MIRFIINVDYSIIIIIVILVTFLTFIINMHIIIIIVFFIVTIVVVADLTDVKKQGCLCFIKKKKKLRTLFEVGIADLRVRVRR